MIVRIDAGKKEAIVSQALPAEIPLRGGRALTSHIVCTEVPPLAHPLGPRNKVVFCPGILGGTSAPSAARISVGAKSPLTGGIKESNAGTSWAYALARLQIHALIIEGIPAKEDAYAILLISWDAKSQRPQFRFDDAADVLGLDLYDAFPKLIARYGKVHIAAIGVSGEMKSTGAGIAYNDMSNEPSRYSARGGLGAVLGSKGIKAIVLDMSGAPPVRIANEALFTLGRKTLTEEMLRHSSTKPGGSLNTYGTAGLMTTLNAVGALSTRNFSKGQFDQVDQISGRAIVAETERRLGKKVLNHGCSPGCIIRCSNSWYDTAGKKVVSCIELESAWAFGSNCEVGDLDVIAVCTKLCNGLGLDTIEAGATIGVLMEAGVLAFGDANGMIELLKEVGRKTPVGRLIASGAETVARVYGVTRCPTVKGQSMPAYEPRFIKGLGVTYATTPMGADHTAGYTLADELLGYQTKVEPRTYEGKLELSRHFQVLTSLVDASGHCMFVIFPILSSKVSEQAFLDEINGIQGTDYTFEELYRFGKNILQEECRFNEDAGINGKHDRLPEFMELEPSLPSNEHYALTSKELGRVHHPNLD